MLLPDFSHLEPFISTRSLIWGDFSIPVCGLACLESSLLAPDSIHLGFPLLLQGFACLEPVLPVLDVSYLESSPFVRSLACLGFAVFALDSSHLGFPLSVQGYVRSGPVLLAPEPAHSGLLLLSQGCA